MPYLYWHNSGCEHRFYITDARLPHPYELQAPPSSASASASASASSSSSSSSSTAASSVAGERSEGHARLEVVQTYSKALMSQRQLCHVCRIFEAVLITMRVKPQTQTTATPASSSSSSASASASASASVDTAPGVGVDTAANGMSGPRSGGNANGSNGIESAYGLTYLCEACFADFHYDAQGNLLEEFDDATFRTYPDPVLL